MLPFSIWPLCSKDQERVIEEVVLAPANPLQSASPIHSWTAQPLENGVYEMGEDIVEESKERQLDLSALEGLGAPTHRPDRIKIKMAGAPN